MQKLWKRVGGMSVAAALCVGMLQAVPFTSVSAAEPLFSAECEDLTLADGASVATDVYGTPYPGYTGDGFVWVPNSGTMTFTVDAPETGMYRLMSKCIMYLGDAGTIREGTVSVVRSDESTWTKNVNITRTDDWNDYNWGDIKLTKGENTISFGGGWGFCIYDSMTLTQTPKPNYETATDVPVDAKATSETKALMSYLKSVYGSHILSGQQEIYGGGNDGNSELEFEWLMENTGKMPAIRGFDFMNYNPLYGWDDGTTERAIDWATKQNGIVTASWHINVPLDFENYTLGDVLDWKECTYKNSQASNSTFDTKNAIVEGTKEYEYFQAAMEDLAEQLTRLQDAGVPIVLRPLHEAQGNEGNYGNGTSWFWWGDDGSAVYKELWKLLYSTLTEKYDLHNIIWEYNSYNYSNSDTWYPGDEYVDIVAYDKYNVENNRDDGLTSGPNLSAISPIFNYLYELTNGKKMVAMAENDTVPSIDNLTVENAGWLYFCPWYGDHLMSDRYNNPSDLNEMYNSDYCITLDELPDDLYTNSSVTPGTTDTTTGEEQPTIISGDLNDDKNVDGLDLTLARQLVVANEPVDSVLTATPQDTNGDGTFTNADIILLVKYLLGEEGATLSVYSE